MGQSRGDLLRRCVPAAIPPAIVIWLFSQGGDRLVVMLAAFPPLLVSAIVVFPSMTSVVGEDLSEFLFRQRWQSTPRAPLSAVDKLLVGERWSEAELLLLQLSEDFPQDMEIWSRLFRLVWAGGDIERARACHRRAMQGVVDPGLWDQLNHLYLLHGQASLNVVDGCESEALSVQRRTEVARRTARMRQG